LKAAPEKKLIPQLATYGAVGLLATAAHYGVMAGLISEGWFPVSASTAGAIFGAFVAYFANRKWTFEASHSNTRMVRFMAVAALGLLMNAIFLMTIQSWLIPSIIGAQLLTTLLVFVATFFINLKWSFS
jgi:putative flippase GtrA